MLSANAFAGSGGYANEAFLGVAVVVLSGWWSRRR